MALYILGSRWTQWIEIYARNLSLFPRLAWYVGRVKQIKIFIHLHFVWWKQTIHTFNIPTTNGDRLTELTERILLVYRHNIHVRQRKEFFRIKCSKITSEIIFGTKLATIYSDESIYNWYRTWRLGVSMGCWSVWADLVAYVTSLLIGLQ